jgi:hypothetical protein
MESKLKFEIPLEELSGDRVLVRVLLENLGYSANQVEKAMDKCDGLMKPIMKMLHDGLHDDTEGHELVIDQLGWLLACGGLLNFLHAQEPKMYSHMELLTEFAQCINSKPVHGM